jgi:hypothetical protein
MYLRLAIESIEREAHPSRVPFLITSRFSTNLGMPRSAVDLVLAANEKIE